MGPKSAFFASPELAVTLVKALYGAKNRVEYPLRIAALLKTMEADRLAAFAAEVSGRPLQEPQCACEAVAARKTLEQDDGAHAQRGAHLHKLRKTLLRKQRYVPNKKPPQGWPQALKKRRQRNLGRKRKMSPHRRRLQERQPTTSRTAGT
jgi:hypothetical protein